MNRFITTLRFTALALAAGFGAAVTTHAQVFADLVNDYTTTGLPLTATGTGSWNFYASTTQDPTAGALTALTYQAIGNAGNSGYGLFNSGDNVPAVSALPIFGDGADPAGSYLAWHPGNSSPVYTVISWTAGTGESGPIQIAGTLSRQSEPSSGSVNFFIYVNGVLSFSQSGLPQDAVVNYNVASSITAGQTVSLVLDPNGPYIGDESLINATITAIPEPSTYAMLAGLGALGLVIMRRRRQAA